MRRSFFLTRRLSHRRHPRYHYSHTRRGVRRGRASFTVRRGKRRGKGRKKGGGIGNTVAEKEGVPVSVNALRTNSKGVTRSVADMTPILQNSETEGLLGDDDI